MKSNPSLCLSVAIGGVIVFFVALWCGCFLLNRSHNTWAEFPAFVTTFVGTVGGAILAVGGAVNYSDAIEKQKGGAS